MSRSNWVANRRIININSGGPIVPQAQVSGIPDDSGLNRVFVYSSIIGGTDSYRSCETKLFLTGSIAGSDYDNLSHNNAISMRAKLKLTGIIDCTSDIPKNRWGIGLNAYSPQITTETTPDLGATAGGGYSLELITRTVNNNTIPDTMQNLLVIKVRSAAIPANTATIPVNNQIGLDSDIVVTCSGSYANDTWHYVRFDLIPTSTTTKILTAYTSSDSGTSWQEVGTYTVSTGSLTQWSPAGYFGFNSAYVYDSNTGFVHTNNVTPGNEPKAYIGDFKINVDPINFNP